MSIESFRPSNVPDFYLRSIPSPQTVLNMIPFSYNIPVAAFAAAGNRQQSVNLFADSDFLCISTQSNDGSTTATVILSDSSNNWPLMNRATPIFSIFGNGTLPYYLPIPWFLIAKTNITADVTVTGVFAAFVLTFTGLRIYRR